VALRARVVLAAAEGRSNQALARGLGISRPAVLPWRRRYPGGSVPGPAGSPATAAQERGESVVPEAFPALLVAIADLLG
jgi:hypothetical protein